MLLSITNTPSSYRCIPAIRYGTAPDQPVTSTPPRLDLLVPESAARTPAPIVVYLHGGGWAEGSRAEALYPWFNPLLAAHGFLAAGVTYQSSRFAPFPAQLHDAKAAIRWLRAHAAEYGGNPSRVGVWGDSAGGHLAALVGVTGDVPSLEGPYGNPDRSSTVQAVVARSAPTDFTTLPTGATESTLSQLFGGPTAQRAGLLRLASPIFQIRPGLPPFLLVHGTNDETVPYGQATAMADALRSAGNEVTLHTVSGGYHNLEQDPTNPRADTWAGLGNEALEFFSRHLLGKTRPKLADR